MADTTSLLFCLPVNNIKSWMIICTELDAIHWLISCEDFKGVSEKSNVTDWIFRYVERIKFLLLNKSVICYGYMDATAVYAGV